MRFTCVTQSLVIACNLVAVSFTRAKPYSQDIIIIHVQKSVFNLSCNKQLGFKLSVTIRTSNIIRCIEIIVLFVAGVGAMQSCFSQVGVLINLNRIGIALISITALAIVSQGFVNIYSIWLSVKSINSNGIFKSPYIQRAIVATIV
jgi:hypothetical protein